MWRQSYFLLLAFFLIWSTVGLFIVAFSLETVFDVWGDVIYMTSGAAVVFFSWVRFYGWQTSILAFLWVAVISATAEIVGVHTGVLFGDFHYTENFGPLLFQTIPMMIPLAWWIVLGSLFMVLDYALFRISTVESFNALALFVFVPLGATLVDLTLEPVAFLVREYWVWESGGFYYGVPLQNFFGWIGVSLIGVSVMFWVTRNKGPRQTMAPLCITPPLLVLFSILLLFWAASLVNLMILAILIGFANLSWVALVFYFAVRSETRRIREFRHRLSSYERKIFL
ncbi:MAG: carotenoid biosynthesis protein [Opitutales bacterium]|nr:carotenoid biosynthesis protein [Opitutales bacterium]